MNLDPRQLGAAHRFCNKIWQSFKFVSSNLEGGEHLPRIESLASPTRFADRWILSRLNSTIRKVTGFYENYDYLNAAREIRNFYWNEFCDWYIEISKFRLYDSGEKDKIKVAN